MTSVSRLSPGDPDWTPQAVNAQSLKSSDTAISDAPDGDPDALFGKEGITFHDVLEMFNPLQHLPVIGTVYRELTGDETKPGVRLIGGLLFGGPTGMLSAGINNAIEYHTGRDIGGEIIAAVTGKPMVTDEAKARLAEYKAKHGTGTAVAGDAPATPTTSALVAANNSTAAPATDAAPAAAAIDKGTTVATAPVAPALPARGSIGVPPAQSFSGAALPPGLPDATGLSGKAGLPSAGSITPAALMAQLGQQPAAGRGPALNPGLAAAMPVAASITGSMLPTPPGEAQRQAEDAAGQQVAQDAAENAAPALRMPPRTPIAPRMPAQTRASTPRVPVLVPADAVTASAASQMSTTPSSDAPIILGTPNAAAASLTPTAQIPDAMLRALDKYDTLIKNRRGGKLDQTS